MPPKTHFYIYEDLNLVCNRVFNKDQITIGRSQEADLYLDHHSVEDIHALVNFKDNQVFLTNKYPQNGLRLNGRAVGLAELQHEDVIDIGPFSLKIKMTPGDTVRESEEDANYVVRLVNRYSSANSMQNAASQLAKILKTTTDRVLPLLAKDEHILKRGLTAFKAAQVQNALLREGVVCDVQLESIAPTVSSPAPASAAPSAPKSPPATDPTSSMKVRKIPVKETFRPVLREASRPAKEKKPAPVSVKPPGTEYDGAPTQIEEWPLSARSPEPDMDDSRAQPDEWLQSAKLPESGLDDSRAQPDEWLQSVNLPESGLDDSPAQPDEWLQSANLPGMGLDESPTQSDECPQSAKLPDMGLDESPTQANEWPRSVKRSDSGLDDSPAQPDEWLFSEKLAESGFNDSAPQFDDPPPKNDAWTPSKPPSESDFSEQRFSAGTEMEIREAIPEPPPVEVSFTELFEDEVDDDEEDVWEATFSLKTRLDGTRYQETNGRMLAEDEHFQVVKTIGQAVVDVSILTGRQKYNIDTDRGTIRLIDLKPKGESFVSILQDFSGYIQSPAGETTADLDSYKTSDYLKSRRKSIYRIPVPQRGSLVVEADGASYQISSVRRHGTPEVAVAAEPPSFTWRHWASSTGVHLFLFICLAVHSYLQTPPPKMEEPHFVQVDPSVLQQEELPKPKPKPKPKEPPPPKPEPVKVAEKPEQIKKKPVKKKKPVRTAKRRTGKKVANAGPVSRHKKAGGGFGKGNIKNRNINQTGILSVLGSSSIGGPSQAIASVTNLDAVQVPGATERNFTVGGVKGALGNGKISVATGGAIMQTKGSKQVLRSAGARGKGHVAALERGTTGKKKVQAMVSAKMSRTVKIQGGGMTRAMVKQVIDQHLDEVTLCYESALMNNPSIGGRITFEWKIKMNGRVGEIRIVASNVNSHELHNCIKSAIKSWQFPKPSGAEVVVSYPFVFDLVTF